MARFGAAATVAVLTASPLAAPASGIAATVLHVCPRGCAYRQVQPAVDAAAAGDIILVGPGAYAGGVTIGKAVTVTGSGPRSTVIAGGGPVLTVTAGPVLVQDLTITGGHAPADGGGILNTGTLTVVHAVISHNAAAGLGGGIANDGSAPSGDSVARLILRGDTVNGNTASSDGGGLANLGMVFDTAITARADVSDTAIRGNTAASGGGGVADEEPAALSLRSDIISGNAATDGGGGVEVASAGASATIRSARVTRNSAAEGSGGGIEIGRGALARIRDATIRQNSAVLGGGIAAGGGVLRLTDSAVIGNRAVHAEFGGGFGGGIEIGGVRYHSTVAAITATSISGNSAGSGGGLDVESLATVTLDNAAISRNTASAAGGGIHGEGVFSALTLDKTSVTRNIAGGDGGGILNYVRMKLTSDDVNANSAAGRGGGIFNDSERLRRGIIRGFITLGSGTTVNRNQAAAGGGIYRAAGTVNLAGATVRRNAPDDCAPTAC